MRILRKFRAEDVDIKNKNTYKRIAARGIILDGENILLMYTKRYDDYSFPGGGVDKNEKIKDGLLREIHEETGATNIKIISEYGIYDEIKPTNKTVKTHTKAIHYDYINMISYFYICSADKQLGHNKLEDYEINNGMKACWVNIYEAIEHNKKVIQNQPKSIGLYVDRELFMLELVAEELVKNNN